MKIKLKNRYLVGVLLIAIVALGYLIFWQSDYSAKQDPTVNKGKTEKVPNQIIVGYKKDTSKIKKNSLEKKHKLTLKSEIPQINTKVYRTPNQASTDALLSVLSKDSSVAFVEQDQTAVAALNPNDPWYINWQRQFPKMGFDQAWDISTGSPEINIAVLDSGIQFTHEDLVNKITKSWNVLKNNSDATDIYGHGTAVASVVGADTNNGTGVSSACWECRIMPIKITEGGFAYHSDVAKAITWAADNGSRVANISYSSMSATVTATAYKYFKQKGGLVFGAAGNQSKDTGLSDNPDLIIVSGTNSYDLLAPESNFGREVDVSATNTNYVAKLSSIYGNASGTSISSPHAAGVAGLIYSVDPTLTPAQVEEILEKSADDLGDPGWDKYFGWGRVNAYKALLMAQSYNGNSDTTKPTVSITSPVSGSTVSLSANSLTVKATATDNVGVTRVDFKLDNGNSYSDSTNPYEYTFTNLTAGTHTLTATAYDVSGNFQTATSTFTVNITDTTKPTVSITSPTASSTVTGTTTINATATDNVAVKEVIFYATDPKDGTNYPIGTDATSPYSTSWNTTTFTNGISSITAVAYDTSNNQTTSSPISVTISNQAAADTTPPTVSISSPTNGATVSGNINISVTASDNVAVQEVFATLTNDTTGIATGLGTDTTSTYTFTTDSKLLTNGSYTLQVTAVDASNNIKTTSITINIQNTVDSTAPTITITSPANNSTLPKKPTVAITNTHTDNVGVARVELYIDSIKYSETYSYPFTFNWNTKKVSSGSHTLQLKAYDQAGNVGTSATISVVK